VLPARTSAGYRLYDEAAVATLRRMKRLVDAGWSPAQAADAIRSGRPILDEQTQAPATPAVDRIDAIVSAARDIDALRLDRALDDTFLLSDLDRALESILMPALVAIGDGWASGEIDVAGEHLASHAVLRRLSQAFEAAGSEIARPRLLVGLPPGGRHEIGALAFATIARRRGMGIVYLGPDTPIESWGAAVAEVRPDAAVMGLSSPEDAVAASRVAATLGTTPVYVGGSSLEGIDPGASITVLGGLGDAVEQVRTELRARRGAVRSDRS
jgi:DNA-binding transcriptional MerR regulator